MMLQGPLPTDVCRVTPLATSSIPKNYTELAYKNLLPEFRVFH